MFIMKNLADECAERQHLTETGRGKRPVFGIRKPYRQTALEAGSVRSRVLGMPGPMGTQWNCAEKYRERSGSHDRRSHHLRG